MFKMMMKKKKWKNVCVSAGKKNENTDTLKRTRTYVESQCESMYWELRGAQCGHTISQSHLQIVSKYISLFSTTTSSYSSFFYYYVLILFDSLSVFYVLIVTRAQLLSAHVWKWYDDSHGLFYTHARTRHTRDHMPEHVCRRNARWRERDANGRSMEQRQSRNQKKKGKIKIETHDVRTRVGRFWQKRWGNNMNSLVCVSNHWCWSRLGNTLPD